MSIGSFLFGSDPGKKSRKALETFGLTGGGELGMGLESGLTTAALLSGARARQASGQRLARAGLAGSGISEDIMGNADLLEADFLRKARLDMIMQRLQALGITASQPRQPGFLESAIPAAATFFTVKALANPKPATTG